MTRTRISVRFAARGARPCAKASTSCRTRSGGARADGAAGQSTRDREFPGQIENLARATAEQLAERRFGVAAPRTIALGNRPQHERVLAGPEHGLRRDAILAAPEPSGLRIDALLDDRPARQGARVRTVGFGRGHEA